MLAALAHLLYELAGARMVDVNRRRSSSFARSAGVAADVEALTAALTDER